MHACTERELREDSTSAGAVLCVRTGHRGIAWNALRSSRPLLSAERNRDFLCSVQVKGLAGIRSEDYLLRLLTPCPSSHDVYLKILAQLSTESFQASPARLQVIEARFVARIEPV